MLQNVPHRTTYRHLKFFKDLSPLIPGSCQHLLLATMFALNFCYQPADVVLVIKCGILDILSMLTNNSCALMNQGWFAASTSGPMMLSSAVKLACNRLLQILTVVARWELMEHEELQENTFWWQAANRTLTQSRNFIHITISSVLSAPVRTCCRSMCPVLWWQWCASSSRASCTRSCSCRQQREKQQRRWPQTPPAKPQS